MAQATVRDIEDIVTLGKQSCVCPYYATRKAVKQAHVCSHSLLSVRILTISW